MPNPMAFQLTVACRRMRGCCSRSDQGEGLRAERRLFHPCRVRPSDRARQRDRAVDLLDAAVLVADVPAIRPAASASRAAVPTAWVVMRMESSATRTSTRISRADGARRPSVAFASPGARCTNLINSASASSTLRLVARAQAVTTATASSSRRVRNAISTSFSSSPRGDVAGTGTTVSALSSQGGVSDTVVLGSVMACSERGTVRAVSEGGPVCCSVHRGAGRRRSCLRHGRAAGPHRP